MSKKILVFAVAFVILVGAIGAGGFYYLQHLMDTPKDSNGQVVLYDLKPGTSVQHMLRELEDQGIWQQSQLIAFYLKINKKLTKIKVGEYDVSAAMTPRQILELIVSGKSKERPLTIPEGYHVVDIAALVEQAGFASKDDFLKMAKDPNVIMKLLGEPQATLEGYLFPETYMFTKYTSLETILEKMVGEFKKNFDSVNMEIPVASRPARVQKFTRHQIVTMASLVEKETGAPEERPEIASVFYNRLDINMRLQTDPTILYGRFMSEGTMPTNITRADLTTPNPYNTYVIYGLPPGPICNPGREAMKAALRPATTKYLFFVSKNDGTHMFTENLQAHTKAVNFYQKDPRQREGKSWRDLKNKK